MLRRSLKALYSSLESIPNLNRRNRKKDKEEGCTIRIVSIGSYKLENK